MTLTSAILDELNGRRVALVYSFPKSSDPPNRWYDRWHTRVIMSYGEALERIGVIPFYLDVDTFIEKASTGRLPDCDAAMSLNAGVRPVSSFAVVPAVAQWFQVPIIPCTADVIMAGERKDLGNSIAERSGLRVPKLFGIHELMEARQEGSIIVKPRDLGGSFGLKLIKGTDLTDLDFADSKIVQKFVSGYDVTVPVFVDSSARELVVGDATVYLPSESDQRGWIYDREAKKAYVGGTDVPSVSRIQVPLRECASNKVRLFASMIGVDCFARVDFRLEIDQVEGLESIGADELAFIEINPMPTVCVGLAFIEGIRSHILRSNGKECSLGQGLKLSDDYDIIAYVLGHALSSQLGPTKMNDRDQIGS